MQKSSYKTTREDSSTKAIRAIRILSNENRFSIMKLLLSTKRDLCVQELSEAVGISQSATSHQLAYLEAYGVVKSVRTGKTKCYVPTDTTIAKKVARIVGSLK